jgi:hypothetical protein
LPAELDVYAATAGGNLRPAGFAIDESGAPARVVDAVVNAPGRKVALMLSYSGGPTIWNLQWTAGTDIRAVWVSGDEGRNVVSGLPKNVPILETRRTVGATPSCPSFVWYPGSFANADGLAAMAFARPVTRHAVLFNAVGGKAASLVIGLPPTAGTVTTSSDDRPPGAYASAAGNRTGAAGLMALLGEGVLRPGLRADLTAWRRAWLAKQDAPPIDGDFAHGGSPDAVLSQAYVVQRALRLPAQLHGAHSATFIVPQGVPMPEGDLGHATLMDFGTLTCRGSACPPEVRGHAQPAPVRALSTSPSSCALPWAGRKPPSRVYSVSSPGFGTALHMPGDSQAISTSDVVINAPGEDVALILSSSGPRLWGLRWSAGTRIVAVYAGGSSKPRLYGLPASVPSLTVSSDEACPLIDGSQEGLTRINAASRRAFGKPVTAAVLYGPPGRVHIGPPLAPDAALEGAAGNAIDSLTPKVEDPIASSLAASISRGLLRHANAAERREAIEAWPRLSGNEAAVTQRSVKEAAPQAYVILRPFEIPRGMDVDPRYRGTQFIVPKGVPTPTGSSKGMVVVDMNSR